MRVLMLVIVLLLGAPALADEPPAPLDLQWGLSAEKVRAMGVALEVEEEDGPWGMVYSNEDLARLVEGAGLVKLYFGFDDRLWRIVIYSRKNEQDGHAEKAVERYDQLNRLLAEKYGRGQKHHDLKDQSSRFLARDLARNLSQIATYYDLEQLFIALEVKGIEPDITYWMLLYAHKELTDEVMKVKKEREKNKL